MAYTQQDLDALRNVMKSGVLEVQFPDGRKRRFQSLNEMMALERVMVSQIAMANQAADGVSRRRFATYSKGT